MPSTPPELRTEGADLAGHGATRANGAGEGGRATSEGPAEQVELQPRRPQAGRGRRGPREAERATQAFEEGGQRTREGSAVACVGVGRQRSKAGRRNRGSRRRDQP
eukprot:9346819-Alexandrium_andersonii.AAC.1